MRVHDGLLILEVPGAKDVQFRRDNGETVETAHAFQMLAQLQTLKNDLGNTQSSVDTVSQAAASLVSNIIMKMKMKK